MNRLSKLIESLNEHEATNNSFYDKWMGGKLSIEQVGVFTRNYREFTYHFPEALALLIANTDNILIRMECTKTLYSEMGNGEQKRVHVVLFDDFCKHLSTHLGSPDYLTKTCLQDKSLLLPETRDFIDGQRELYSGEHSAAVGAQLALEWQAYTMVRKLYEGARNYKDLWNNQDEFHEACEFFYVHIGSAEKEHKIESIHAALELIQAGGSFMQIEAGFKKHLSLIATFWKGIAEKMEQIAV